MDQGVAMDRHDVDETDAQIGYDSARIIPVEADFLVAYSSPEGIKHWPLHLHDSSSVTDLHIYFSSDETSIVLTIV